MLKKPKRINTKLLMESTLIYRVFIILEQYFILWLFGFLFDMDVLRNHRVALGLSILWNLINMVSYYIWHYVLLTRFGVVMNGNKEE